MQYPGLPNNRLIVNGVDLSVRFQIALLDGYELNPPEPKTYTVDIPGGNGVIDLTEALTGDVAYNNRSQSFTFACINPSDFEKVKTKLSNYLHGRFYDYKITMDPDYTYHGRFKITSYSHSVYSTDELGVFGIEVDANPYKTKEKCVYKLNATGGKDYRFESGRRLVHPVIECEQTCFVTFDNVEYVIPAGSNRLNNVLFREGFNNIYINTCKLWNVKWEEISQNGTYAMTWEDATKYRWDDIQRIPSSGGTVITECIVNGSFENDLTGWTVIGSGAVINSDTGNINTAYAGTKWFKGSASDAGVKQTINVESGKTYHISFASGSAAANRTTTYTLSNGSTVLQTQKYVSDSVGWKFFEFDYTVPDNVTNLTISLTESGWCRFDAISITTETTHGSGEQAPSSWSEIADKRWSDLSTKKWSDLDYRIQNLPETTAYLSYDWEDL